LSFNPNSTQTLGLEWPVAQTARNYLDAISKGQIERFTSSSSETIDKIEAYLDDIGEAGMWAAEVYLQDDVVPSNQHTERSTPRTSSGQNTSGTTAALPWEDSAGGAVGPADFTIDDGDGGWDDTVYVYNAAANETAGHLSFRGGGDLTNFDGLRVLRVDIWIRAKQEGGAGINARPTIENAAGTDLVIGDARAIPFGSSFTNYRLARLDVSPLTGKPWTAAEATTYFSNTSTRRYGARFAWQSLPTAIDVSALWADIVVADENRVAYGTLQINQNDGWKAFTLEKPDGTDNWAKTSGTEYDVMLRRVGAVGNLAWPYLSSPNQFCPHVGHRTLTATLNGAYGTGASIGAELVRAHPIRFVTTGAADSADSQPYARLGFAQVYSGSTWRSEFAGAAATGYGFIKAVLRPAVGAPVDLADLTIRVRRTSDDVQLGGTYTLTKEAVDQLDEMTSGAGWKLARFQISTATLATGVGYYIEFSSTAGGGVETRRWDIAYISAEGHGTATYGGTASSINISDVDFTDADFCATIAVPPAAPSGWATAVVTP